MRLLHTSDWHLGRTLAGYDRADEHVAFLDELVLLARDVDAVLITGDVFDSANPPIASEALFFEALARLGDGGRRPVLVIAGNHDAPDRIVASQAVSGVHGAFLFGRPGDVSLTPDTDFIRVHDRRPSRVELEWSAGRVCFGALPFPSESRLRALIAPDLADEFDAQQRYSARVGAVLSDLCDGTDAPVVLMSHLHVRDSVLGSSERTLVGGAWQVDASALPERAAYVALGHVHKSQAVAPNAWYAGAPLAFRMDERDVPHVHLIVTLGSAIPEVTAVPVQAGRRLVRLAVSSLEEVAAQVEALADCFVEVEVPLAPTTEALVALRRLPLRLVRVRVTAGPTETTPSHERSTLAPSDLFRTWVRSHRGHDPDDALVSLFVELCNEAGVS